MIHKAASGVEVDCGVIPVTVITTESKTVSLTGGTRRSQQHNEVFNIPQHDDSGIRPDTPPQRPPTAVVVVP